MSSGLDCGVNQVLKYVLSRTLRKVPSLMEGEVQEANAGVKETQEPSESHKGVGRCKYKDCTPEDRVQIGNYVAKRGPAKAVHHCSELLDGKISETTPRSWLVLLCDCMM